MFQHVIQHHIFPCAGEKALYLFMYFGPAFDFGHNHSHYLPSERGSKGEELLVGGDVLIP